MGGQRNLALSHVSKYVRTSNEISEAEQLEAQSCTQQRTRPDCLQVSRTLTLHVLPDDGEVVLVRTKLVDLDAVGGVEAV